MHEEPALRQRIEQGKHILADLLKSADDLLQRSPDLTHQMNMGLRMLREDYQNILHADANDDESTTELDDRLMDAVLTAHDGVAQSLNHLTTHGHAPNATMVEAIQGQLKSSKRLLATTSRAMDWWRPPPKHEHIF